MLSQLDMQASTYTTSVKGNLDNHLVGPLKTVDQPQKSLIFLFWPRKKKNLLEF